MTILIVVILIGMLVLFAGQMAVSNTPKNNSWTIKPYISKKPLTPTEITFYQKLTEALPEYVVLAQVQLSCFIKVDLKKIDGFKTYAWQNAIAQQSVDYLICNKDFSIVTAIELDDKTHLSAKAIKNDSKKNDNLAAAEIPLIRWHAESMPSTVIIQQAILNRQSSNAETPDNPAWVADDLPTFMRPKQTIGYPIKVVGLILLIGISYFFIKETIDNLNRNLSNIASAKPSSIQKENIVTKPSNYDLQMEHQRDLAILERQRKEDENQKRLLLAQEFAIKEEVWNNNFKNKFECTNSESIVTCGNDYIRNREKFEKYWEMNKSRHISTD